MRTIVVCSLAVFLAACGPDRETRMVGEVSDPWCMPNGAVVLKQYANSQGSFEGTRGAYDNCNWNKPVPDGYFKHCPQWRTWRPGNFCAPE